MVSIKGQITLAMQENNEIGKSKREFRMNNDSSNIHSIKYYKDALDTSIKFGEFCKINFGVKKLGEFKPEYLHSFLREKEQSGCSMGHLINLESHLIKLQIGIEKLSKSEKIKNGFGYTPFIENRMYKTSQRELPKDRSYTQEEINIIKSSSSDKVQQAIDLSLNLGLRIKETCNIRVEHIVVNKEGRLEVLIPNRVDKQARSINDVRSGAGTTKGGRFREISIPQSYEKQLSELLKGKNPKDRIITLKESTLRSALKRACEKKGVKSKGWHGFRHTYARRKLEDLLGSNRDKGLEIIKQMLKNQNQHMPIDKGVKENLLFEFTIQQINKVHSELGHGKNRWGLMAVYLSF